VTVEIVGTSCAGGVEPSPNADDTTESALYFSLLLLTNYVNGLTISISLFTFLF